MRKEGGAQAHLKAKVHFIQLNRIMVNDVM